MQVAQRSKARKQDPPLRLFHSHNFCALIALIFSANVIIGLIKILRTFYLVAQWDSQYALAMRIAELKCGDILLMENTRRNWTIKHLGIIAGQLATSVNPFRSHPGRSSLVHALIFLSYGEVAEASGESGTVRIRKLLRKKCKEYDDSLNEYAVYRCKDHMLGVEAASAAISFAGGGIGYAKGKAFGSILHSDTYGKHGKSRGQEYADQLSEAKKGPNFTGPFAEGGAFCTEFVIACYQAAAIHLKRDETGEVLECDAKHCSVRALDTRLLRDNLFGTGGYLDLSKEPSA